MSGPLIAIVGDADSQRTFDPPMKDSAHAVKAAEELGAELARRGARLLVYGGPFIEADVVRGFVAGKPAADRSVLMWYTMGNTPPPFPEEAKHPKLFERRSEQGVDWEVAFYRSITRADGVILIGGGKATMICGHVAIGARIAILAISEFGGAAAKVWQTLAAGEDLPTRSDISLMARPWTDASASICVTSLLAQCKRRQLGAAPPRLLSLLAAGLFIAALAILPWVWGKNAFEVWMLFAAPLLAGGAGATIRPIVDRVRGTDGTTSQVLVTLVLGLVAGGIAGVFFVTAQLTADPNLTSAVDLSPYATRSIPYAMGIGFVAGLTSDAVLRRLLGLDVVRTAGIVQS